MGSFENRVAIVTGGATGIGGATARRLAQEGARVLIADVNMDLAKNNVEQIQKVGGVADVCVVDLSRSDEVEGMVNRAVALWGRLDILVNNAWNIREPDGSAETLSESAWDYAMSVMVKAIFLSVKYAVPHMVKTGGGSIVNMASVHGMMAARGVLAYDTAKTAVIGMTRQMALDFGPKGIRVNAICPGHIVTERIAEGWKKDPTRFRLIESQYPVGRAGKPEDIAHAVRFLCSDEASFITGHALVVDGGLTLQLQETFGISQAQFFRDHPDTQI